MMYEFEKHEIDRILLYDSSELKKLILENPNLSILCFASQEANLGDYSWETCMVRASKGEFLDCCQMVNEERIFFDRDDFREALEDKYEDGFDGSEKEFDQFMDDELAQYEPYWKPCIILYAYN